MNPEMEEMMRRNRDARITNVSGNGSLAEMAYTQNSEEYLALGEPSFSIWKTPRGGTERDRKAAFYSKEVIKNKLPNVKPRVSYSRITGNPMYKTYVYPETMLPRNADLISGFEVILMIDGFPVTCELVVPGLPNWVRSSVDWERVKNGRDPAWNLFWGALNVVINHGFLDVRRPKCDNRVVLDQARWRFGQASETLFGRHQAFLLGEDYVAKNYGPTKLLINETTFGEYHEFRVPVGFHFTHATCNALPYIALYDTVKVGFEISVPPDWNVKHAFTAVDYVFLPAAERRMFAHESHEYRISRAVLSDLQCLHGPVPNQVYKWETQHVFSNPTRSLVFAVVDEDTGRYLQADEIVQVELLLNNEVRFHDTGVFFMYRHPSKHGVEPDGKHFLISFCETPRLRAGVANMTGICNFSHIDSVRLRVFIVPNDWYRCLRILVYQDEVNILRIERGTGGLKFAS